jgi:phosphate-selective porin OprO/OprP
VALSGRLQYDYAHLESGDEYFSDANLRRLRFGVKAGFLKTFTVHAEADFHPEDGDIGYKKLTDAYVSWNPSNAMKLTVGKHSVGFTMDGQTSSKELLTIDRSNLTNNIWFTEEYIPGISMSGEKSGIVYNLGYFSSGSANRGFGHFDAGKFVLATIGHDFGQKLSAKKALLRLNYVDNEPDPENDFTRPEDQIVSLNFDYERDRWGVRSDISTALGYYGQSDLSGFMVMPFFSLSRTLQLVTRYTHLESDDPNGVRLARYESSLVSGRGDEYTEFYVGLNDFMYGHKLKLQTGLQYADMNDRANDGGAYTGWSWTTGFRVSW